MAFKNNIKRNKQMKVIGKCGLLKFWSSVINIINKESHNHRIKFKIIHNTSDVTVVTYFNYNAFMHVRTKYWWGTFNGASH